MNVSREDADQFFRLMWGLQFYVKERQKLLPKAKVTSKEQYASLPSKDKLPVRDALWKNRQLIEDYVRENPDKLSPEDLAIVRDWTKAVIGPFCIYRFLKQYTVMLGEKDVYAVLGLYDPLPYIYRDWTLPIMVEGVLLPYKGRIVYDGIFQTYRVHLGGGIRSTLNEQYMKAKQNGRIIVSLAPEAVMLPPAGRQRPLGEETQTAVEQITAAAEYLRGGDAVQKAAFQLVKASAGIAGAAVRDPDNADELWRLAVQVNNAIKRLFKVLERAETHPDAND